MPGEDNSLPIAILEQGTRKFSVHAYGCDNPTCRSFHIQLSELLAEDTAKTGRELIFAIDGEHWRLPDIEGASSPKVDPLVTEFMASYPTAGREAIRTRFLARQEERHALETFELTAEERREHLKISWADFLSGRRSIHSGGRAVSFSFTDGDEQYIIDDLYCWNPECECESVTLVFARQTSSGNVLEVTKLFEASISLVSYEFRIDELIQGSRRHSRNLVDAFLASKPNVIDILDHRLDVMKALGQRYRDVPLDDVEAPVRKERRVGRNAPCPCGSGKKYKKCCGR